MKFLVTLVSTTSFLILSNAPVRAADSPRVLLIGDSHTVGTFGHTLDRDLRDSTVEDHVTTAAVCGSSPSWWLDRRPFRCGLWAKGPDGVETSLKKGKTPSLAKLLHVARPSVVVFALGSNLFGSSTDEVTTEIADLLRSMDSDLHDEGLDPALCFWVGPPNGRNKPEPALSELYAAIADAVAERCALIDSRLLTAYPDEGGDGAHFDSLGEPGREIARAWAHAVAEDIIQKW